MGRRKAAFLDRDDTIMEDVVYCRDPDDVHLIRGAAEGIRALSEAGYLVVITTNQSGVGRGLITLSELTRVNDRLRSELRARGAAFQALYYCPHTPADRCPCRKPMPGMLLQAASDLDIDLSASFSIGDRESDVEAGRRAGTRTVLVPREAATLSQQSRADFVVADLRAAARAVLRARPAGRPRTPEPRPGRSAVTKRTSRRRGRQPPHRRASRARPP